MGIGGGERFGGNVCGLLYGLGKAEEVRCVFESAEVVEPSAGSALPPLERTRGTKNGCLLKDTHDGNMGSLHTVGDIVGHIIGREAVLLFNVQVSGVFVYTLSG